ncbi:MAG: MAPEG family protein [Alphaproteobacteria bacterium]|nr:MAPEG family protein [Alphaproteobacteria bacterium]
MDKAIFYPMLAMAALTVGVVILLAKRRFAAVNAGETKNLAYFKTFQGESPEPMAVQAAQRNFANLFELPMLFYPACLAAGWLDKVDTVSLSLAWAYVALRFVHTLVHVTGNDVRLRFKIFFVSIVPLIGLWGYVAL